MRGRLVRVTPAVIGADVGDLRAQSQPGGQTPAWPQWPGVAGPGGIGPMGVRGGAASVPARSVAVRAVAGGVGSDKYGRLTAIAWPPVRPAPLPGGQDKDVARAQHAVGLAGRFELDFQLPLNHQDQIDPVRGEPVRVDGLGQLAHPDHFDALPGEYGPDLAERGGPDLTGLAEHDVENFRGRAATILDRHEILSVGGDVPGPAAPRDPIRSGEHLRRGRTGVIGSGDRAGNW
jgi:hypothetical protein